MTRKDYILIAEVLIEELRSVGLYFDASNDYACAIRAIATRFGDKLASDNPRFDREHFLAVMRGEKELTSRPPRKRTTEEWAERLADRMNNQAGDCQ